MTQRLLVLLLTLCVCSSEALHAESHARQRLTNTLTNITTIQTFRRTFRSEVNLHIELSSKAHSMFQEADQSVTRDVSQQQLESLTVNNDHNDLLNASLQTFAAFASQQAAIFLQGRTAIDANQLQHVLPSADNSKLSALTRGILECPFEMSMNKPCDSNSKFREPTGRCTHLSDKLVGMTGTAFDRLLSSAYEDGVQKPRTNGFKSNHPLPSPRKISTQVTTTNTVLDRDGPSVWVMQWGQFMAHEYTHIDTFSGLKCCSDQAFRRMHPRTRPTRQQLTAFGDEMMRDRGDKCLPIQIPRNDPTMKSTTCMEHTRSKPTINNACLPGPREQKNTVTGAIDASAVYGSDSRKMNVLRSKVDGKLRVQHGPDGDLLPKSDNNCRGNTCPFAAGDDRVSVTPNLISAHTVFVRMHNLICHFLKKMNRHWNDERLFQEARRIIAAIQQHIHYDEWLQVILGDELARKYDLKPVIGGEYYQHFNPSISTQTLHECATAACRMHSLIGGQFTSQAGRQSLLKDFFSKPNLIYREGVSGCIVGMTEDIPWVMDKNFDSSMRDKLFGKLDIVALNINRGRDHGLRSYVDYRKYFGLPVPKNWRDLRSTHPRDVVNKLRSLYHNVGDVELFIGGVTESRADGSLVGPLFGEIIAKQFMNKKKGDRFFYENPSARFSADQIKAIKDYSLAKLLCDTTNARSMSPNVFLTSSAPNNGKIDCDGLKKLDLVSWKERSVERPKRQRCQWEDTFHTHCCKGQMTITRKCLRDDNCQCIGRKTQIRQCRCSDNFCRTSCGSRRTTSGSQTLRRTKSITRLSVTTSTKHSPTNLPGWSESVVNDFVRRFNEFE